MTFHGHFQRARLVHSGNMWITSSTSTTQDHALNFVNLNCNFKNQFPFSCAEAFAVFQGSNYFSPKEHAYQFLMIDTTGQKSKENRESKQSNKPFSDVKHFHMDRGSCKIYFGLEITKLQEAIRMQFSSQKNRTSAKPARAPWQQTWLPLPGKIRDTQCIWTLNMEQLF